jgi:hypothetical protein
MQYIIHDPDFNPTEQNVQRAFACAIQHDFAPGVSELAPFVDVNAPLPRCPSTQPPHSDPDNSDDEDGPPMVPAIEANMRPLVAAVTFGFQHVVLALLGLNQIDVNVRAPDGKPVLFYTLWNHQILQAICAKPTLDVNARDLAGNTVLHILSGRVRFDQLCCTSSNGLGRTTWTPGQNGSNDLARAFHLLLDIGADPNCVNKEGKTPWGNASTPEEIEQWILSMSGTPPSDFPSKQEMKLKR